MWGAVLIVLGIFLTFIGNKFVNAVIFIVMSLAMSIMVTFAVFQLALSNSVENYIKFIVFAVCIIFGCGFGWLTVKYRKVGIGALAGWGGAMLGFLITASFFI